MCPFAVSFAEGDSDNKALGGVLKRPRALEMHDGIIMSMSRFDQRGVAWIGGENSLNELSRVRVCRPVPDYQLRRFLGGVSQLHECVIVGRRV